ncbi:malate dehydrogenase [Moniliophthora roreri MCA 2997]|uniref:Malate dehydrogenase n=1 Tax=Moniliophthora roreri (strain MCA 2997) TaxID=1381753 RepID=V2X642_MONRO|nr:malate dehydrogenase [Moniliophthora roreri MCA 2997]
MRLCFTACSSSIFGLALATCDVSGLKVPGAALPAQSAPTRYVTYGTGSQNYTCGSDGKYAPAGAVARIFDISCTYNTDTGTFTPQQQLGNHYFVANPAHGSGLSAKWDFNTAPETYVVAVNQKGIPAPTGPWDIDWLYFSAAEGSLATEIYRTHTKGGQPPASCKPGSQDIAIWYNSLYWFTGGSA